MEKDVDTIEAIERLVLEIDALTSIICDHDFNDDGDAQNNNFFVTTPDALDRAKEYVKNDTSFGNRAVDAPSIGVEVYVRSSSRQQSTVGGIRLRVTLPPGYPSQAAAKVTVLSTPKDFPKSNLDELSVRLSNKTKEMIGCEVMMEVINECRDVLDDWDASCVSVKDKEREISIVHSTPRDRSLSRRWIWVHHITNPTRLKQIVQEAQQLKLGGYLKGGCPGVVVIEGSNQACDEFVVWIKGNKSRPGGFGRNWGHHVRGEATIEACKFPETFVELEDDMGRLGSLCRYYDVGEEFREFILQHK